MWFRMIVCGGDHSQMPHDVVNAVANLVDVNYWALSHARCYFHVNRRDLSDHCRRTGRNGSIVGGSDIVATTLQELPIDIICCRKVRY